MHSFRKRLLCQIYYGIPSLLTLRHVVVVDVVVLVFVVLPEHANFTLPAEGQHVMVKFPS